MSIQKIIIIGLSVLIIAAVVWKVYDYRTNTKIYSKSNYESELNIQINSPSSPDKLITSFQENLLSYPENSKLLTKLGAAYIQKAKDSNEPEYLSQAENVLKKAIELERDNFFAIALLGTVNQTRMKFKDALELGQRAFEMNPYSAYALGVISDAQISLGMYDEGFQNTLKAVDIKSDANSLARLSKVRELTGEEQRAIDVMKTAISAGSPASENTAWRRFQLGNLFYNKGDLETAEKIYEFVSKDFPENPYGYAGLAKIKMNREEFGEAIELYLKSLEKKSLVENVIALGDAYYLSGQKEKSDEEYHKVKLMFPVFKEKGIDTDLEFSFFNATHNINPGEASEKAGELIKNGVKSIEVFHTLAWINFNLGNFTEAERNIQEALRLGTKDPMMYFIAGKIFSKLGQQSKSDKFTELALKINPYYNKLFGER